MEVLKGSEIRVPMPWGWIAGKAWGSPTGHPVLGIHGWQDNAGTFDKVAPLLSPSLYFVAIELPGHGRSSHLPPGTVYHFADYSLVIQRIVKHFKWGKFSIIGHSLGAGIGATYASVFPSKVENLVLLDLIKPLTNDPDDLAEHLNAAMTAFLTLEETRGNTKAFTYFDALDRLVKSSEGLLTPDIAKCLMIRGTKQVDDDEWAFSRDLRILNPVITPFSTENALNLLKAIRCRVLFLRATNGMHVDSPEVMKKVERIYERHCREFKTMEVDGNHFFHMFNPKEVSQLINMFLVT